LPTSSYFQKKMAEITTPFLNMSSALTNDSKTGLSEFNTEVTRLCQIVYSSNNTQLYVVEMAKGRLRQLEALTEDLKFKQGAIEELEQLLLLRMQESV
jgi:hypothetical protein